MAVFTKNATTGTWTTTTLWSPTGYPGQNGAADQASWNSTGSSVSVANATLGQIRANSLTVSPNITNVTGQVLTLSPAANFSGIGVFINHTTSSSFSLSISGALRLAESQSFSVYSGNTLTIGGVISSANLTDVLTKVDTGTLTLSAANTFGGSGGGFVASAGLTNVSGIGALGNVANTVTINSGAAIGFTAIPNQTAFSVAGTGSLSQRAALHSTVAFAAGKIITVTGGDVALSFALSASFAAKVTGTSTGDVILNFTQSATTASFNNATTDFTVGSGKYVRIRSVNVTTGAGALGSYVPGASEAGLGNALNKVFVESTASVSSPANSTITLARDYKFEGEATSGGLAPGKNWAIEVAGNASAILNFTGTIEGTAGYYVKVVSSTSAPFGTAKFSGAFSGSWNLQGYGDSYTSALWLDSTLNVSSWTGSLDARLLTYGMSPGGAVTYGATTTTLDSSEANLVVSHSSYTRDGGSTVLFTGSNSMTLTGGAWSAAPGAWNVAASTLSLAFSFTGTAGTLTKSGVGTLALSGNNTAVSAVNWTTGSLTLNSAGSAGTGAFTAASTGTLDSTGATLSQTGTNALNAAFSWKGTSSLTFGSGSVTTSISEPTITFAGTGETGTLKFSGAITTSLATVNWNFGGSTAGAKQRVTLGGANGSLSDGTAANQHAVTAGHFRIENNNGLGAVAATTTWWVGATNAGVQTTKAALELAGVTTPDIKSVNLYNIGPNDEGALIGVSGTSEFRGNIAVPNVAGTRIGVKSGATLTLLGSGIYPNLNPANANTPLSFTAESSGTLNQNRILGANVGTVTVTGGSGTVVFSRANLHTGAMTCSAGTTKLTHANAAGAGAGNNATVSPGATMEVTVKAVFPATLTLGSSGSAATFKVSV